MKQNVLLATDVLHKVKGVESEPRVARVTKQTVKHNLQTDRQTDRPMDRQTDRQTD